MVTIFRVRYVVAMEAVEARLEAHRAYLDGLMADGRLIASGPCVPRTGGVYVCNTASEEEAQEIMRNDPFFIHGVAEYELIQMRVTKHNTANFEACFE